MTDLKTIAKIQRRCNEDLGQSNDGVKRQEGKDNKMRSECRSGRILEPVVHGWEESAKVIAKRGSKMWNKNQKEQSTESKEGKSIRKGVESQIKEDQHHLWTWKSIRSFSQGQQHK